jgi:hypothetical protein
MSALVMQAVQQSLYSKLSGDALLMDDITGVHDTVPQRSALPYVVIGGIEQEALPAIGETLWRVGIVIDVWSEPQGRKVIMGILSRLQALLHHASLSMSGADLREMRVDAAYCELAEQATRMLGSMELTLIVAES